MFTQLSYAEVMRFDVHMKYSGNSSIKESQSKVSAKLGNEFVIDGDHLRAVFVAERVGQVNATKELKERGIILTGKFYNKLDSGEEKLLSQPEIIVFEGDRANFTVQNSEGEKFELNLLTTSI